MIGNRRIPTDFRYPKPDVFRLHHKQKAASLCRDGTLLRGRQCSTAVKNASNSVWIKQNSKDSKDQTTNRNKENYGIIKESIPVHQKHPLNYGYGSMTTFEKKQSQCNNNRNTNNNDQHQSSEYRNEENLIKCGILISPNTSSISLPHKKRKIVSEFSAKSTISCDKSPLIEEFPQDLSREDVSLESINGYQGYNCPYYSIEQTSNTQYDNSDIPNYATIHNCKNATDAKENDKNPNFSELQDHQNVLYSACNNFAQKVPKTLNLSNTNQRKIVPHQPIKETITPIIEKVLSPVGLPMYDKINGMEDMHDVNDKFISPNSAMLFNADKAESKVTSPQISNSSIFKIHPSIKSSNDAPNRNIIQFSSSKSCLQYRKAIAISGLAFSAIMIMTFSVLYWNYVEALHRRMAKTKDGPILDHWGKVSRL